MPIDKLMQHPALKPTVLIQDVLENVYRPAGMEGQDGEKTAQAPGAGQSLTRERNRAA